MPRQLLLLLVITALLIAMTVGLMLWYVLASPAGAQGVSVADEGSESLFPEGIQFRVLARSDQPVVKVRLRYTVFPDGSPASAVPEFEPAPTVSAGLILGRGEPYLPPGTRIDYHWEAEDAAGNTASSPEATIFYEDVRFDWTTLEANGVALHYYSGSETDARAMLDAAREAIGRLSTLLDASVEFPVNVRTYASVGDMRPALQRRSPTYDEQVITAGVKVSSDTVLVLGNASFSTLRHELAHIVTAAAGEGPFGNLPAWLDEGTAVYAQDDPEGFRGAIERAIDRGNVFSVRSITSYQGDPSKVNLFYGQSWSLVSFLIETYGEEKFARLFAEIKSGRTTDSALEAVYGFDQDGLENEWRASVGLPPREPVPDEEEPVPTTAPPDGGTTSPQPESGGGGASAGVLIGLALGILAAALAIGAATVLLARRFR